MMYHIEMGDTGFARARRLKLLVAKGVITLGGNQRLKIYGTLTCRSGKSMHLKNRVFFASEAEATGLGYRPCARCMPLRYKAWKTQNIKNANDEPV